MVEIQEAQVIDAEHTFVITTSGERKFHINGGWDEETEKALADFVEAGGVIQPPRARPRSVSRAVEKRFAGLQEQFNPAMAGHLAKKKVVPHK
jgi:hypothetical protein